MRTNPLGSLGGDHDAYTAVLNMTVNDVLNDPEFKSYISGTIEYYLMIAQMAVAEEEDK